MTSGAQPLDARLRGHDARLQELAVDSRVDLPGNRLV